MFDTSGLNTASPDQTIRSDAAAKSSPLPTLSVDLRLPPQPSGSGRSDLEVRSVIGEGGMGRVLLARQHSLARDVAVKTVKPDASDSARAALVAEGAVTGQLEHPAIVPVHALGMDALGNPALVMKRVEGMTWDALMANPAHPGWEGWEGTEQDRLPGHLQILISVANALHFAHSRGVVHRDVKPQNVLIGRFSDVYLADWGVAGELGANSTGICGTPAYLAPEMVEAGVIDARTDVYLLGSTLHHLLTGAPRHPGATITDSLQQAQLSPPHTYAETVPAELGTLANRACHKDPAQRPATARAFRDQLVLFIRHRDAVALAQQAQQRRLELEPLLHQDLDAEGRERLERLLAEARFGLEQSLTQYPENPSARAALDWVEDILARRRRKALDLERAEKERDPVVGARQRTVGLFLMTVLTGTMAVGAQLFRPHPTNEELLAFPTIILISIAVAVGVFRKVALATKFSRQAIGGLCAGLVVVYVARLVGLWVPIAGSAQIARDSFVIAGAISVLAITMFRWATVPAILFLVSGVLCSFFPERAILWFSSSNFIGFSVATWASYQDVERMKSAPPR